MVDEDPYQLPTIDESKWFVGGHLGSQIQSCNWQVGRQRPFLWRRLHSGGWQAAPWVRGCSTRGPLLRFGQFWAGALSACLPSCRPLVACVALHAPRPRPTHPHNLQVVNCTTPANYFHVLRRQLHRQVRSHSDVGAPTRQGAHDGPCAACKLQVVSSTAGRCRHVCLECAGPHVKPPRPPPHPSQPLQQSAPPCDCCLQFRKPLVMFSPKNLLRHPLAKSPMAEFSETATEKDIQARPAGCGQLLRSACWGMGRSTSGLVGTDAQACQPVP